MESFHLILGLPWAATIFIATVAVRTSLLPVTVYQLHATNRFATKAKNESDKLWRLFRQSVRGVKDISLAHRSSKLYFRGMRAVMAKHQCHPLSMFAGTLVQLPVFLTFVLTIRHMIQDSSLAQELSTGGLWWFSDLTVPDDTLALPLIAVSMTCLNLEMSMGTAPKGSIILRFKDSIQALLICGLPLTTTLPQGIFMYWVTSAAWSAAQTALLRKNHVRTALGLPALVMKSSG